MTLSKILPFSSASALTFDSAKIEVVSGKAQLKLFYDDVEAFSEDFTDDTGFTYDNTKAEFTGGLLQQKDQRPANAVFAATYTSSVDASWPTQAAVLNGAPVITAEKLVCSGTQGAAYTNAALALTTTGTIKFRYTPAYTTSPPTNINLIGLKQSGVSSGDRIIITHSPSGNNIRLTVNNDVGGAVVNVQAIGPAWQPTSGVTYEFELGWNSVTGFVYLFIDGLLHGTYNAGAWTRTNAADTLVVGATSSLYDTAAGSFSDVVVFSDVQHTSGYTAGYTLAETIYLESSSTIPTFSPASPGLLRPSGAPTSTETGTPKYIVQGYYWDGADWSSSDGTYAQATSKADIVANIGSFPSSGANQIIVKVLFGASNSQSSVSQIDFSVQGELYPTDNPSVYVTAYQSVDAISSFSAVATASGSDAVKYIVALYDEEDGDVSYKYWNGTAWVASDGTYAQSNTAAEINTNVASLSLTTGYFVRIIAFLHSDDGQTTPDLTSITYQYSFFAPKPAPNECIVYGWLSESTGDPIQGTVTISNPAPFYHTGLLIPKSEFVVTTDANGYWEASLIENATVSKTYNFTIDYTDAAASTIKYTGVTVPDSASSPLSTLVE